MTGMKGQTNGTHRTEALPLPAPIRRNQSPAASLLGISYAKEQNAALIATQHTRPAHRRRPSEQGKL
jgi:hypothetical protein